MSRYKWMRVSDDFGRYVKELKAKVKTDTGKQLSSRELTSVLANIRPSINLETNGKKKRKASIFDF